MVPTSVQSISDPVERTRAYMDSVATRWQAVRNLDPPLTESQFWLDTAEWEAYYQLRRGGMFGITAADWQGAWKDTEQWDQILSGYEAKFLGQASGPNVPIKPGAVQPPPPTSTTEPQKPTDATSWIRANLDVLAFGVLALAGGVALWWELNRDAR